METPNKICDLNNEAGNDSGHATESDDGEVISQDSLKRSDLGVDEPPELQIGKSFYLVLWSYKFSFDSLAQYYQVHHSARLGPVRPHSAAQH